MPKVNNISQAQRHSQNYLHHSTLVVDEQGNIYASCDVEKVCDMLMGKEIIHYVINGNKEVTAAPKKATKKKAK